MPLASPVTLTAHDVDSGHVVTNAVQSLCPKKMCSLLLTIRAATAHTVTKHDARYSLGFSDSMYVVVS